ncbi:MAG: ABC transporter permease [Vicinamibacterales bacterium]
MAFATQCRILLRRLLSRPGFAIISVLTLAIGIAANIAIFTVVNAVLLRPLPVPDSDRLVILRHSAPALVQLEELPMSDALYFLYANESRTLDGVALFTDRQASFTGSENPQRVASAFVTASFFDVLRTPPRVGRAFRVEDERPDSARVVVLSDDLWRTRFGADPDVIGRIVEIAGEPTEVVGVMPPKFAFPRPETQLWQPVELDEEDVNLGRFGVQGLARLEDDYSLEQVEAELGAMASNLEELFPDEGAAPVLVNAGFTPMITPVREFVVGDIQATLWILLGAVGFLLLIACANVANLFLARSEARRPEVSIRLALGENRSRLVGSILFESLVLGLAAGVVALPLALLGVQLLVRFGPQDLPRLQEISVDGYVLVFGLALSSAAGLLFGLLPACRAGAVTASSGLIEGARGASAGRARHLTRRVLVVAQVALALTLLIGSGLAVRSFQRLASVDPGFDSSEVLTFRLSLPERNYETAGTRLNFHRQMVDRLAGVPGVLKVAAASTTPLGGSLGGSGHSLEDHPQADGEVPPVFMMKQISPGYFDAMGIELVEGRDVERLDEERQAPVVIVSRSVARAFWPGMSALGKGIRQGGRPDEEGEEWSRVVGVADDVHEIALHINPPQLVYYPLARGPEDDRQVPLAMSYVVRAEETDLIVGLVRDVVRALDPNLPISDVVTLETLVAQARTERAFVMVLLIIAAALALVLGSVGLYGVISYMVAQRRHEIAIRMAIGAQMTDIHRMVLVEAGWMALLGTALGIGSALLLTRRLQALLFETSPLDPVVFIAVSTLLVGVCLFASWLPAHRAARIDPATALRFE